jgi:hypothetical protein
VLLTAPLASHIACHSTALHGHDGSKLAGGNCHKVNGIRPNSAIVFGYVLDIGGNVPNRKPKLSSVRNMPLEWIWVALSNGCRHKGIHVGGQAHLAIGGVCDVGLTCSSYGHLVAAAMMLRLCEPGCSKPRG